MINGYFYGYGNKNGAAFGVWLRKDDMEYIKTIKLKAGTNNLAELHALEYALKCIKNTQDEVTLESCNSYVPRLFIKDDKGNYKTNAERNKELVERTRTAAKSFNLKVTIGKSELMAELQKLVKSEVTDK